MIDTGKLDRLRDITLKHIPVGHPDKEEVLEIFNYIETTVKKDHTWVPVQEASSYYGVSTATIHSWRKQGRIQTKKSPKGERIGYKYYLDPVIKRGINALKKYDGRWQ